METKFGFKNTPEEKLEWIASINNDPRLSQINRFVSLSYDNLYDDFYCEKYAICLYKHLAETCLEHINQIKENDPYVSKYHPDMKLEDLYLMTDEMYEDIIQNNKYGFIYDW